MKFIPGPHKTVFGKWEKLKLFIAHVIENHRRDWNPDKPRDFIDAYLKEIEKVRKLKCFLCFVLKEQWGEGEVYKLVSC